MSIELKDPDSNLNSLVDQEQEEMLMRMKLNKDLSEPETVEVVSPLVLGDGTVNYLQTTTTTEVLRTKGFQVTTNNRLSLNDKMKNVLFSLIFLLGHWNCNSCRDIKLIDDPLFEEQILFGVIVLLVLD